MTEVGINHEPEIDALVRRLAREGRIGMVELIVDGYRRSVPELRGMVAELGVPYAFHNVLMSIGSADFSDHDVELARQAVRCLDPMHYSEHLTCSRAGDVDLVQNLGIPMTEEMVAVIAANILRIRRSFGSRVPFLVENIATHWRFDASHLSPDEFITSIVRQSGARILLDLHNLYVDEVNFGWDARRVIDGLPLEIVDEVHVTGGSYASSGIYLDSHDARIPPRVWELLCYLIARRAPRAIVLERSAHFRVPTPQFAAEVVDDLDALHALVRSAAAPRRIATCESPSPPARVRAPVASPRITMPAQRRWLRALATPSRRVAGMRCARGALSSIRGKYAGYVEKMVARAFPRFAARAGLSRVQYLRMFRGRDPLAPLDVDWLYARLQPMVRGMRSLVELLRVERAIAKSLDLAPTRLSDDAIGQRAGRFRTRRTAIDEVDGVQLVRLRTAFAVDFPTLQPRGDRLPRPAILAIVRRRGDELPTILRYD